MRTLLDDSGFWLGAAVAAAVVAAIGVARLVSGRWWAGAGTAAAIGGLAGLSTSDRVPTTLVAAVALLGVAALATQHHALPWRLLAALPGSALLATALPDGAPGWVPVFVGAATVIACALLPDLDGDRPRLTGICLAVSTLGVYVTVPDTEEARTLVGAAVVGAVLGLAPDLRRDAVGASAAIGLLTWTAGTDGIARPGAVVGGVACVGVLVLGRVVRRTQPHDLAVLAIHVALVLAVARGAGLRERALLAGVLVAVAYLAAIGALVIAGRVWPRARRRARRGG